MKTRVIPMLVIFIALLSCEESLQVDGPKIPDVDKTVTVILSDIPSAVAGGTMYLFSLNNKGQVYAIHETEAIDGTIVEVAPAPGFASFDIVAFIPTGSDWTSKDPFTEGYYSMATAIQDRHGEFVTKTWSAATTLANASTTGLTPTIKAELLVNNSATPVDTDFTKGEIVTLDATVTDNIKSNITSVAFFLDATEITSYTTKPYKFQFNTVSVTPGSHWLYVKALNALDHESLDSIRIFVSDLAGNVGPAVSFTGLTNGDQITRQNVIVINANATDPDDGIDDVEFRINGSLVGTDNTAPYSFTWDTFDNNVGAITVEITATDKAGQTRSDVVNVTLVAPTNYAPRAVITGPTNGASFPVGTATVELTATTSDAEGDPINRVEFSYRKSTSSTDTFLGQDTASPYSFTFNTSALTAGTYYIFAKVYDNGGNSSYKSITITIQ